MFIFIDESGQFAKHNHEEYFVIASFTVDDPRRTEKAFRAWCRSHFSKKSWGQNEVKWSAPITDSQRLKTLRFISELGINIKYSYLRKERIPHAYWDKKKLKSGFLYVDLVLKILDMYLPSHEKEFRVFCDERPLREIKRGEFKNLLISDLTAKLSQKSLIQIEILNSSSNANIQIADWVTGALARYHEGRLLGKECFKILKNNITSTGNEMFVDE